MSNFSISASEISMDSPCFTLYVNGREAAASATHPDLNPQDRLSALPDPFLLSILSRVPIFDVVRTAVLARRWRHLWTFATTLDFDDCSSSFRREGWAESAGITRKRKRRMFERFVDKVLSFHNSTSALQRFRLSCSCAEGHPVQDWARIVVTRGLQELDLRVKLNEPAARLPSLLFASQSLVELKLDLRLSELKLPGAIGLVGLRSMHLRAVSFVDDYLTSELFSSCSALESLTLVDCKYGKLRRRKIITPLLQDLVVMDAAHNHRSGLYDCKLKLSAPRLTSFMYRTSLAQNYDLGCLPCLVDVEVHLLGLWELDYDLVLVEDFLSQLSSTRKLKICEVCVEALPRIPGSLDPSSVIFCRLNSLAMDLGSMDYIVRSCILGLLVVNCQCLKILDLQVLDSRIYLFDSGGNKDSYITVLETYSGQTSGVLEEVHITSDNFTEALLDLVKILLGNQPCLQRLLLVERSSGCGADRRSSRVGTLMRKVQSFPRRSLNLSMAFL